MLNQTRKLKNISNELEDYIQMNCPIKTGGKPNYLGEGCGNAYEMLAETTRNIATRELEKK